MSVDIMLDEAIRLYRKHQDGPVVRRVASFKDQSEEAECSESVVLDGSNVVLHGSDAKRYMKARGREAYLLRSCSS